MIKIQSFPTLDQFRSWLAQVQACESAYLDFKANLSGCTKTPEAKSRLCHCFASFANSNGGHVIFGVKDSPRDICGDSAGDEFLTLLDKALSQIKPKIDAASITLEQRVSVDAAKSVFIVRIEPSAPMKKPHMVDGQVPARLNGHSNRIESGEDLRQLIGEMDISALSSDSIMRLVSGLKEISAVRDLTFINRKTIQDVQIFFHRKAALEPTFTNTKDTFDRFCDSLSELQKLRDGSTSSMARIIECNTQVTERFAHFEREYRLVVGGFQL